MIATRPAGPATFVREFWGNQLGKKYVMAVTGVVLFGYVVAHMVGNLKAFMGAESLNHYAEWLRDIGEPAAPRTVVLWLMRSVLGASFVLHVVAATQLTLQNRRARPVRVTDPGYAAATYASRTMRWSGIILALFVLYHLAHMTWGVPSVHPDFVRGDVYHNAIVGFRSPVVVAFYAVAQAALGLHLYHGVWSLFQSLGINGPRFNVLRKRAAQAFALLVTAGFMAVPVAVLAGVIS